MSPEAIGAWMLVALIASIFIGFPIAFTLIAVAAIGGWLALGPLALHLFTLQVFSVMRDPTLASVPFFLFMGYLLEQSGLMERLFRGVQLALASVRGSPMAATHALNPYSRSNAPTSAACSTRICTIAPSSSLNNTDKGSASNPARSIVTPQRAANAISHKVAKNPPSDRSW